MMPEQKPHRSKQDYCTPPEFLSAVVERFGPLSFDLAASVENAVTGLFVDERRDSLAQDWSSLGGNLWLNPPYSDIRPWARKCCLEARQHNLILLLTPASVGSEWFADHVFEKALVLFLRPRMTFVGCEDPYPKDLMLSLYGNVEPGFALWRWKP